MASLPEGFILEQPDVALPKAELPEGFQLEERPRSAFTELVLSSPSMAASATGEVASGLAGLVGTGFGLAEGLTTDRGIRDAASERGAQFQGFVRDLPFFNIEPPERSRSTVEDLGETVQGGVEAVRAPVAGLAGLAQGLAASRSGRGVEAAAETIERIMNEGIGPTAGSALSDIGAPPEVAAIAEAIPTGIATVLGLRGTRAANPQVAGVAREFEAVLRRQGIDPTDASPENLARIQQSMDELIEAGRGRVETLQQVGVDRPTRAQVTRDPSDFQRQQEAAKRSGPVRAELEVQEGQLARTFDEAVESTGGRVNSGSSVIDEVVGRSTNLDDQIGALYRQARAQATGDVNLDRFARHVLNNLDSDGATGGLFSAVRGELRRRGVLNNADEIVGQVTVDVAEDIRQFINSQFDAKNRTFANIQIRQLKDVLDDDVFRQAGQDVFNTARRAKADFEQNLRNAGVSRFDRDTRSLVRDILENKIDPDRLVQAISTGARYRAEHLRQLRDYLNQTDEGIRAFDDLRAQVLANIRDKAFTGAADAQGVQALSAAQLRRALDAVGDSRLEILFTVEERALLNRLMAAARVREPVRGTAIGKGPSAQAIEELSRSIEDFPVIGRVFGALRRRRDGQLALAVPRLKAPQVRAAQPPEALLIPAVAGSEGG